MKKLILLSLIVFSALMMGAVPRFANETLRYRVTYKWGLINKQAGTATLTITDNGDTYTTRLTAASEPWADHFYQVRDTLNGIINKANFAPLFYEKLAHEGGEFKHDIVRFSYVGQNVTGDCYRRHVKKGNERISPPLKLNAYGTTVDMLSSFYYMRSLPFESWATGHKETITIFSGKRKEALTFQYKGIETVKVNDHEYRCYHITFIFTGDGSKKTSDDMDAWITADSSRIPVQLEGKLAVGKVRCFLIN